MYILSEQRRKAASCSISKVGPSEHLKLVVLILTGPVIPYSLLSHKGI